MNELGSLLKMLDHEKVSPATADKMASVRNILDSLQLSGIELGGSVHNLSGLYFLPCLYLRCSDVTNPFKIYELTANTVVIFIYIIIVYLFYF